MQECTGNGGPGSMEYSATTGRLGSLLGLEGEALGLGALLARDQDNQLFLGLGRRQVRAKTARRTFNRLDFGDNAATLWLTALARDAGGSKIPAECQGTNLAGTHTCSCTASGRISSEKTHTEPGLRQQRGISPLRSNRTLVVLAAEQVVVSLSR
jgi:hypothetical protein